MQLPLATVASSNCCQQISWHQNIFLLILRKKEFEGKIPPPFHIYITWRNFIFCFILSTFFPLKACEVKLHWSLVAYLITYISMQLKLPLGNIKYTIRFLYAGFIRFSDFCIRMHGSYY